MKSLSIASSLMVTGLLFQLGGCGSKTGIGAKNEFRANDIMNTWTEPCKSSDILDKSKREFYQFTGSDVVIAEEYYSAADCTKPSVLVKYSGTFAVQDDVPGIANAKQIDLTINKVTMVAVNESGRKALEAVKFCRQDTWATGKEVDMTANSGKALCPLTDVPYSRYDIIQVTNDSNLVFGKDASDNPSKRPSRLDEDVVYTHIDRSF